MLTQFVSPTHRPRGLGRSNADIMELRDRLSCRTRYAKSGNVHVAYKAFGNREVDLVFVPGFVPNIATAMCEVLRWTSLRESQRLPA